MAGHERAEGEEVDLSTWRMTSSYPSPSTHVQMEVRKILRTMKARKKDTEVVLENNSRTQNDCPKEGIGPLCCVSSADSQTVPGADIDEVDGLAEDVLRPLVKLLFLKILLVDVGISLGDVVTDLLQGLNLVFDGDWNIQWTTYQYGLGILATMWMPGLVVLLRLRNGDAPYGLLPKSNSMLSKLVLNLLLFIFFPIVPTILYLRVLLTKRAFNTGRERLVFLKLEATSHEIKAIAGALESPVEVIILLWLLVRGILQLPWDNSLESSCVQDSLGRVACFPSLPVASIIFSLLSILKALYDLNITPLVSRTDQAYSVLKMGYSCQLLAQFCPFFVCNITFRCFSFAFIITYLDYWAVIPGSMVFLLIVAHTVLVSSSQAEESEEWNKANSDPKVEQRDARSSCSQEEEHVPVTPTPVFLNSLLGFFLPIAYSLPEPERTVPEESTIGSQVKEHSERQTKALRSQALLVNTCTLIVVVAIYCLVTHTSTFNYRSNILTPWWFTIAFLYLLLLFACSLLLSCLPEPLCLQENAQEYPISSSTTRPRSRHPTEESNRLSVYSTSSKLVKEEQGPANLGLGVAFSLLLTLFVFAPTIIGLVIFNTLPDDDIRLLQVKEGEDGLVHRHLTHLTSLNPEWDGKELGNLFTLVTGCGEKEDFKDSALLINMTLPACRSLRRKLTPGTNNPQLPKAIIILEDNPETIWRLSSPPTYLRLGERLPVFRARSVDWSQGWTASKVAVLRGGVSQMGPLDGLKCSDDREVFVGQQPRNDGSCVRRKWLQEDGRITEARCVTTMCSKNGLPCNKQIVQILYSECQKYLHSPMFMNYPEKSTLQPMFFEFKEFERKDMCCQNSSINLKVYGKECVSNNNSFLMSNYCKFSELFSLFPCSPQNLQDNSKFCKISGLDCVLEKSFLSICTNIEPKSICDIKNLYCGDVRKLQKHNV